MQIICIIPSVPTNEFVLKLAIHDLVSIDGGYKYKIIKLI